MPVAQARDGEETAAPGSWAVPVLALAAGIGSLLVLAPGPFLPAMAAEFGIGVALLGQVPALTNLLAALLGLVVGPLADRYGQRRALLLGLLAAAAGALGTGLAPSVGILFGLVGAGALGQATLYPVA